MARVQRLGGRDAGWYCRLGDLNWRSQDLDRLQGFARSYWRLLGPGVSRGAGAHRGASATSATVITALLEAALSSAELTVD